MGRRVRESGKFDADHDHLELVSVGSGVATGLVDALSGDRLTECRLGGHGRSAFELFFVRSEVIRLGFVAVDRQRDEFSRADQIAVVGFDEFVVLENRLEVADAPFHVPLFVLGGVVVAVLGQIAQFTGPFDLLGHVDTTTGREVEMLGLQTLESRAGEVMDLGHAEKGNGGFGRLPWQSEMNVRARALRWGAVTQTKKTHKIAVIGGDGIGPEVTSVALDVMRAAGVELSTTDFDLGGARFLRDGEILSDETLQALRAFDAILLGAVGTPDVPPGVIERGLLLKMRFELDLYVNQRPFVGTAPGHTAPHDFIVIRENTEGPYVGEGGVLRRGTPHEVATQGSVNTRMGVERCIRYAFELASERERKHVTLVHKTNVLTFAGNLWERTFNEVAAEYPGVGTAYNHVDAACIYFVQDPHRYDVIVTDNLFGDILTDLGGAVSGGIGLASSANLNPARTGPSMFEPVHGSAPDIVGTGKANPTAAILSAALMLDFLGESTAADCIRAACAEPVSGSTTEIGRAIAARISG